MEFALNRSDLFGTDDSWPPSGAQEFFVALSACGRKTTVRIFLLVIFGALGTLARYAFQGFVQNQTGADFPTGTLAVNLSGCFLLGVLGQYSLEHLAIPPDWRIGITLGFFGAYTTFSTFSWETFHMMQDGEWLKVLSYVLLSVVGGVLAAALGIRLGERI